MSATSHAPGHPGTSPVWSPKRKTGVGTACNLNTRVWFTLSDGILNEVYYPRLDSACTRDMGFVITDGETYFSEEKRDTESTTAWMETGLPAFHIINKALDGRYTITKEILVDPERPALLQMNKFTAVRNKKSGTLRLYVLLAPFLGDTPGGDTAWIGDHKGVPMLFAQRGSRTLALACSAPWLGRSVGYVGTSDGWQDLNTHKQLTWSYNLASQGNVALTAEIDLQACQGEFLLVLGFGQSPQEAAHHARASLFRGFKPTWEQFRQEWQTWLRSLPPLDSDTDERRVIHRISASVIRCHESTESPGGVISSLSSPWGSIQTGREGGGYHLVWPRDTCAAAGAMLSVGARQEASRIIGYLITTQEGDGRWPGSMWLDGTAYSPGTQLDEAAAPLQLIDLAFREKLFPEEDLQYVWPTVRKAAGYICRNGPITQQDRWEQQPGFSPFSLALSISGLLTAAKIADAFEPSLADYLRQTADTWNDAIESWTYVTDTALARQTSVPGYYMRLAPASITGHPVKEAYIPRTHKAPAAEAVQASEQVSPDALALVRFGLRKPDDLRILNTLKVIDATLKVQTPFGPCWRRFTGDGYGEQHDGSPFFQTGFGRAWPLLSAERAIYELAAGNLQEARHLLETVERFAGPTGLIPEQIWDSTDIPERGLFFGRATGSACPLVWAHAEHLKVLRSLRDKKVFDMPTHTVQRYLVDHVKSQFMLWRFNLRAQTLGVGQTLRIETLAPTQVHWSPDNWLTINDQTSCDTGLGVHITDLPTQKLAEGDKIVFTLFWPQQNRWEGEDFTVRVMSSKVLEPVPEKVAEVQAMEKAKGRAPKKAANKKGAPRSRLRRIPGLEEE